MKMPDNEWLDIFHTIVPVAYCDFVLIDKRWRNFVKSTGLNPSQISKVYAQRNLGEFLKDLENWEITLGSDFTASQNVKRKQNKKM